MVDICRRLAVGGLCAGFALAFPLWAEAAWTAAIKPDPMTRQPRCLLTSEAQTTQDGYASTSVTLVFNGTSLVVMTDSELDPSFNDLQLVVDNKPAIHSDKIDHKTNLVFNQNAQELAQLLRTGRIATVYLRFWPKWPATQIFPVRFSLIGFSKAHDAMGQNCQPEASTGSIN